jgi:hypothetical protein
MTEPPLRHPITRGLLAQRGDLDGLRARADAGDGHAAIRLADLLVGRTRSGPRTPDIAD